ncbi:MAG: hypothetical protein H0W71_03585 [Sphingomonas sp.]|nr:hypothetical protein [Sphingomonas sp.]
MFGVDSTELLIVAVLALLFIGPKDLPNVMLKIGRWVGKVRGYARHFTSGIENVMREAELEEMERKWREDNQRIMSAHPPDAHYPDPPPAGELPPTEAAAAPSEPQVASPGAGLAVDDDDPTPPSERPLP